MRADEYIAYRVGELCKEHSMTKYRLSQITGISQTALANIISQKSIPNILTLEKLCDAFGISLAQFFAEDGIRPDLTETQEELLAVWDTLDTKERGILMAFVRSLRK